LLNYLRSTGRYSHFSGNNQTRPSSNLSEDEAYKILGIKKGCSKEEIIKAANSLQKKIHPDVNPNSNTERLSQIVNEAKETALKDVS
jgi:DnaJ-class molecular chaperone with C-terminal Zn finger domain